MVSTGAGPGPSGIFRERPVSGPKHTPAGHIGMHDYSGSQPASLRPRHARHHPESIRYIDCRLQVQVAASKRSVMDGGGVKLCYLTQTCLHSLVAARDNTWQNLILSQQTRNKLLITLQCCMAKLNVCAACVVRFGVVTSSLEMVLSSRQVSWPGAHCKAQICSLTFAADQKYVNDQNAVPHAQVGCVC